jgi:hypothetical protein
MMALVRSLLVAACIAALVAGSARANEALRVAALDACPSGADGCIEMKLHWDAARTDKPPFAGARTAEGARTLRVRARLGDGRAQWLRLTVVSTKPARRNHLGEVAYLGRSSAGRPVILTDRGSLAIETRGLLVGRGDAVVIIDASAGKISHSFLGGLVEGTYVMLGADRVAVLSKRGACVSPPSSRPGMLAAVATCGDRREPVAGLAFSEQLSGAIAPAPDADLSMIRRLLPQTRELDDEQLRTKIGRLDASHVVVTPWAD